MYPIATFTHYWLVINGGRILIIESLQKSVNFRLLDDKVHSCMAKCINMNKYWLCFIQETQNSTAAGTRAKQIIS